IIVGSKFGTVILSGYVWHYFIVDFSRFSWWVFTSVLEGFALGIDPKSCLNLLLACGFCLLLHYISIGASVACGRLELISQH
ncbi:hypothetical protein KSS87_013334, partial [Heliosperma pusillum]